MLCIIYNEKQDALSNIQARSGALANKLKGEAFERNLWRISQNY